MKSDIIFENDLTDNQSMVDFLRGKVTEWADTIPNHGLRDFGNKIQIDKLYFRPYHKIILTTQYESRKKLAQTRPYHGAAVGKCTVPSYRDFNQWEMKLEDCSGYETEHYNYRVPGADYVSDCSRCDATGKITCPTCGGKGKDKCPTCKGTGDVKCSTCNGSKRVDCTSCNGHGHRGYSSCSRCGGSRQVTASGYSDTSQGYTTCPKCGGSGKGPEIRCSNCHGSGKVSCSSCHGTGKKTCKTCDGEGIVTCSKCNGNKKIKCPTCAGTAEVLNYLEVVQQFKPDFLSTLITNYDVGRAFPELAELIDKEEAGEIFSESAEKELPEEMFDGFPIEHVFKKYRSKLLLEGCLGEVGFSNRVLRQHIKVSRLEVYDVSYTYDGKQYRIALYGPAGKSYALDSPFTDMSDDCFEQAKAYYDKGDLGKSADYLYTSYHMDVQELKLDEYNAFYEKLLKKFRSGYQRSVITGTVVSIPIFIILSFLLYSRPVFIFPFIAPIYNGGLPVVHSLLMGLIYIIFALFFIKPATNGIYQAFLSRVRGASFRTGFTFLFTLIANTFLWGGLVIVSASGLPLIISRLLLNSDEVMRVVGVIIPILSKILGVAG